MFFHCTQTFCYLHIYTVNDKLARNFIKYAKIV